MGLDKQKYTLSVLTTDISRNTYLIVVILKSKMAILKSKMPWPPIQLPKAVQVYATTFITRIHVDIHIKIMNKLVIMSNILRQLFFVAVILNL